ncbi:hypothetical protein N7492_002243 [Penicillium capsulatum]|uniref:Endopolyphosphatase n=1 Tax=Penicillium capsulatum TaxID=69766 RepID=A0A9W9LUY3_9EURO|nr:hypothetical protein N7492_002243 [Penicillium capsulatum]KAJ6123151.1 hypothetical protein N7512_005616 [Penicillium capsulatum]
MQSLVLLSGFLASAVAAVALEQQPLANPSSDIPPAALQPLTSAPSAVGPHGRFLHITDFHPDRHYKAGASIDDDSCHHGKGPAGYFGALGTECDSPISLVNETFRWIEENLKDDIDFVIWTGDSARHDNDERIPRTTEEIVELNEYMAQKWVEVFGLRDNTRAPGSVPRVAVPVVPTFGNNDIAPHNIFRAGPNLWTKKFAEIWRHFIPEDQRHSFAEGGWFTSEVIPGQLAIISLNTMYLYESNSAVDGCAAKSEPGYEHMEWLRVQLQLLRERNMKAIVMGHVAPARSDEKTSWDETCWQKYTMWMDHYRDVIVGGLYGHMNIDHFILQDIKKVDIDGLESTGRKLFTRSKTNYLTSLREQWSSLPSPPEEIGANWESSAPDDEVGVNKKGKKGKGKDREKKEKKHRKFLKKIGGPWAERYSVSMVSPSLVPNYFPTLRVIEYNTTGLHDGPSRLMDVDKDVLPDPLVDAEKKKKKKKKPSFEKPQPPSPSSPPGPAYSNQALTWLRYTQFFANLTRSNEAAAAGHTSDPRVNFEPEYSTDDAVYQMTDLTVRSFFKLATQIAKDGKASSKGRESAAKTKKGVNQVWRAFLSRAFTGYVDVEDMDDES